MLQQYILYIYLGITATITGAVVGILLILAIIIILLVLWRKGLLNRGELLENDFYL